MSKYQILIVDDDSTSLAIGRALLEDEFELTFARSGLQALGMLQSGALPDLILLDMVMPGLGGMEVLSTLKRNALLCEIPVIFLTGESSVEEEVRSYHNGASEFLLKPVNPDMLSIILHRQLSYLKLKRENDRLRRGLEALRAQFEALCDF